MIPLTLVGHPFVPLGRGEDLRSVFRAVRRAGLEARILDVYGSGVSRDPVLRAELGPHIERNACGALNIFAINGDEVEPVLAHLGDRVPRGAYNIIFPAWELERYPETWARQLERFDEAWVHSAFVQGAISPRIGKRVTVMTGANEVRLGSPLGRRAFGIRESSYVFLFAFDLRSYAERKNPLAVMSAFEALARARPRADVSLVMKIGGGQDPTLGNSEIKAEICRRAAECPAPVVVIDCDLLDQEVKSLLLACDAFVSLHRSEGFGRLMAEAMLLGKPVIATAYSGNLEFMTDDNSLLVPYRLVDVREGEYPHATGQVWADADVDAAARYMTQLVDDPEAGRRLGERGSRHIRVHFSPRAIGLRYRRRLEEIVSARGDLRSPEGRGKPLAAAGRHDAGPAGERAESAGPRG